MFGVCRETYPDDNKPNFEKWADTIRLMRERDKRMEAEFAAALPAGDNP